MFVDRFPTDPNAHEARYHLCVALRRLNRPEEALQETMILLRGAESLAKEAAAKRGYWQRRTGNQLANDFYQQGDFRSAMKNYERLSELRSDPEWRWPALYQYGLCLEPLKQSGRAIAAFRMIIDEAATAGRVEGDAADVVRMADWRTKHLLWTEDLERQTLALSQPEFGG